MLVQHVSHPHPGLSWHVTITDFTRLRTVGCHQYLPSVTVSMQCPTFRNNVLKIHIFVTKVHLVLTMHILSHIQHDLFLYYEKKIFYHTCKYYIHSDNLQVKHELLHNIHNFFQKNSAVTLSWNPINLVHILYTLSDVYLSFLVQQKMHLMKCVSNWPRSKHLFLLNHQVKLTYIHILCNYGHIVLHRPCMVVPHKLMKNLMIINSKLMSDSVNLVMLMIKFELISEGQWCRVCII